MKKFTAMICAVAMSASMAITAVAAPSIGQLIPEAPDLVAGEYPDRLLARQYRMQIHTQYEVKACSRYR